VQAADLGRVYEMIGNFPEEQLTVDSGQLTGETWKDYLSRVADEVAVRSDENALVESVAGRAAEVQVKIAEAESHAEAVTKRTVLLESLADAFKLDEKKTAAYGEVSDGLADWYARMTGETRDDFYNRYFGDVKRGDDGPRTMDDGLRQSEAAPVWYSKLERTVESVQQETMTVEQLRGAITKAGVKADELYWTGFDEWMKGRTGKVSKAEALAFLREGGVKVEEVMKGGVSEDIGRKATKFSQYTLPGGDNYRELLFTLPVQKLPEGTYFNMEGGEWVAYTADGVEIGRGRDAAEVKAKARQHPRAAKYKSGHWDEPNVLAHTRFNERVDAINPIFVSL